MRIKNERGQEEMVGFALIIIIVAVILLIFLGFSIGGPQKDFVESFEVESFVQASLQYTTECEDNFGPVNIQDLIFACNSNQYCLSGEDSCEVLEDNMNEILGESWMVGEERPVRGYNMSISSDSQDIYSNGDGTQTTNSKGASQSFFKSGENFDIVFTVYYG